jgi:drug/metabolite transporter (DMT)-like permease
MITAKNSIYMKKWLPIISLIICCMIWGSTFVAIKNVSSEINPFLLSTVRNSLAVLIMFPIILLSSRRQCLKNKLSIKYGFIAGFFLAGIYVVQTTGMQFTSSNHSAFITSSAVVIVPIILVLFRRHKITSQQIAAICTTMIGIYFLTNSSKTTEYNIGDILTFFGAFICAIHIILSGIYVRKTELFGLVFYQFLFGAILSFVGFLIDTRSFEVQLQNTYLFEILYLGIVGTLFCFFVTVWAQKYVTTIFTMMILSLEPVFASLTSYIHSGATFTKIEILGALGILIGLVIYNIPINRVVK